MTREPASRAKAHTSYYLGDGTKVPSVTSILRVIGKGEHLLTWANSLGLDGYDVIEYRKAQAAVGTLGHAMIQADLLGRSMDFYGFSQEERDRADNVLRSYRAWRRLHNPEPILVEEPLVSESCKYGGTIDLYARLGDLCGIIDVKTSNDIYDEHFYQIAAYSRLLVENGHRVDFNAILRVGRDEGDGFTFQMAKNPQRDLAVFDAAHALYLRMQERTAAAKNEIPVVRKRRSSTNTVALVVGAGTSVVKEAAGDVPAATPSEQEGR